MAPAARTRGKSPAILASRPVSSRISRMAASSASWPSAIAPVRHSCQIS